MSFVLRAAFWLTVLAFLLPAPGERESWQAALFGAEAQPAAYSDGMSAFADEASPEAPIGAGEMLSLLARSAEDVLGFCERNPDVCARGKAVAARVADQTIYYGGKLIAWATGHEAENAAPPPLRPAPRPLGPRLTGA